MSVADKILLSKSVLTMAYDIDNVYNELFWKTDKRVIHACSILMIDIGYNAYKLAKKWKLES